MNKMNWPLCQDDHKLGRQHIHRHGSGTRVGVRTPGQWQSNGRAHLRASGVELVPGVSPL